MLPTTAKEHRDFFRKLGAIEFEGVIDDEELAQLNAATDATLKTRRQAANDKRAASPYMLGHDLWRDSTIVRDFVTKKKWGRIACELLDVPSLRMGCDQLYGNYSGCPMGKPTLDELSSFVGTACGVAVALSDADGDALLPFGCCAGGIIFFKADLPIAMETLTERQPQRFLIITYTLPTAIYRHHSSDPHTHALKRHGYIFGDRLKEELNPLIYK